MAQTPETHLCPMHPEVRQPDAGKCPKCGMNLVPEGARFGMLRHVMGNPLMLTIMAAVMVAVMWMVFM
jgi:Heavy metal binding domain